MQQCWPVSLRLRTKPPTRGKGRAPPTTRPSRPSSPPLMRCWSARTGFLRAPPRRGRTTRSRSFTISTGTRAPASTRGGGSSRARAISRPSSRPHSPMCVWSRGLMERVQPEPLGLKCPSFTDELVGREPLQGLEPPGEVVGCHEIVEVLPELIVAVVVIASNGGILDRAVHPFNLTIRPRVPGLGQAMINIVLRAGELERVGPEQFAARDRLLDERRR